MRGRSTFGSVVGKQPAAEAPSLKGRLLGVIETVGADVAELQALFAWDAKSGEWSDLPEKPCVVWRDPPTHLSGGMLCAFFLVPSVPEASGSEGEEAPGLRVRDDDVARPVIPAEALFERRVDKEARRAKRPPAHLSALSRAVQNAERVLDESFLDVELLRHRYFQEGVELEFAPQPQVYLAVRDKVAIGPVTFVRDGGTRWRAVASPGIPVLQPLTTTLYQGLDVRGVRRYPLKPHAAPLRRVALADFRPPEDLVSDCLRDLDDARIASASGEEVINEVRKKLLEAGASDDESMLALYRRLRIEDAAEQVLEEGAMRAAVREGLLSVPAVRELLDGEAASARRAAEERIESDLAARRAAADADYADAVAALKAVVDERDAARAETERAEATVERRREGLRSVQREFDALESDMVATRAEMARLQGEIGAATEARIADIAAAVTERVLSAGVRVSDAGGGAAAVAPPRYPLRVPASVGEIEDGPEALGRLRKRLAAAGIRERAAAPLLAALITRMNPIAIGPAALSAFDAAGDALFGGRILRRTVSALMVEFAELFGRVHPASAAYRPDPERLADLLLTAQEDEAHHLVVFDGFNRSDPDAIFAPLLDPGARRDGRRLPILHPNELPPEDPYARLAEAVWPERFAAVFRYTPRAARPPALMLANSATVLCEFSGREATHAGRRTVLPAHGWASLREAALARQEEAAEILGGGAIPADLRHAAVPVCAGAAAQSLFCAALLACGTAPSEAAALTKDCLLAPPLWMTGQDVPASDEQDVRSYRIALEGF